MTEQLRVVASDLRDRLLHEAAAMSSAEDAFFARWGEVHGDIVYDCVQLLGTPELWRTGEPFIGSTVMSGNPAHQTSYDRHGWDLLRPHPEQINQFRYLHEDIPDQAAFRETALFFHFYHPLEVREQLRALLYDEVGRSMGMIAVLSRGNERFGEGVRERLNARVGAWREALRAAERLDREALQENPSYALVRPWDGEVEFATSGLMEALTASQREQLAVWCRLCFEDDQLVSQTCVYGLTVQSVRIEGVDGPRQLLTFRFGTALVLSPLHVLNPRQRQVFDLIVQGLSNAEIAARFDLSSDTVKYHLKTIFKLLDIFSKSELLLLSRTVWGD